MTQQTSAAGHFRPVGTGGFGERRQPPHAFDQQPVEATATIAACLTAWRADGDAEWKALATRAPSAWFLGGAMISRWLWSIRSRAVAGDGLHPDRAKRKPRRRVGCLLSPRTCGDASACARQPDPDKADRLARGERLNFIFFIQQAEDAVSQASFLNRQGLHLRPDPAQEVIVRPFKPATEPRDLNPTDKMRANHIVDRVLALSSEAVAVTACRRPRQFSGSTS